MDQHTHVPENIVTERAGYNLYADDPQLQKAVAGGGAGWHDAALHAQGALLGSEEMLLCAERMNTHKPILHTHDRNGQRLDSVEFHPDWHRFLKATREHGLAAMPFADPRPGVWTAFAASQYLHNQIEFGSFCPVSMTFASIPVLMKETDLFAELAPKLYANTHDPRDVPISAKRSIAIGMGMTEKQGGSDVRTNSTSAVPSGNAIGRGAEYRLTGHKWFFSAPMCDAHLVLARAKGGLSCFFVPRWRADGEKNAVEIVRLKDKVGNCSNSSSEVEFKGASGVMVGEEGRGIPVILEMAALTRFHCAVASAAFMRQGLSLALYHARRRKAFGKFLADQPLMQGVLADMALESEAAMLAVMRLAAAFEAPEMPVNAAWKRIVTPAAKFWICKRAIAFSAEAMEVFGGNGYVAQSPAGRLYRETPLNSIWEGSGNVMCLDVLRAIGRDRESAQILFGDLAAMAGDEARLRGALSELEGMLERGVEGMEAAARLFVQRLMLVLSACLMRTRSDPARAAAYLDTRLAASSGHVFGAVEAGIGRKVILDAAMPD